MITRILLFTTPIIYPIVAPAARAADHLVVQSALPAVRQLPGDHRWRRRRLRADVPGDLSGPSSSSPSAGGCSSGTSTRWRRDVSVGAAFRQGWAAVQLIVLGMHRSGTSAVTRLLNMAGAYFGPEGSATAANEENPKGFWERQDVRRSVRRPLARRRVRLVAARTLRRRGHSGQGPRRAPRRFPRRPLGPRRTPAVGDQGTSPLPAVPAPASAARGPRVHPRDPGATRGRRPRLPQRNGFPLPVCVALWEFYTLRSVQASVGLPALPRALRGPRSRPRRHDGRVCSPGWRSQDVQGLHRPSDREITAFVDPALHRQQRDASGRHGLLNGAAGRAGDRDRRG